MAQAIAIALKAVVDELLVHAVIQACRRNPVQGRRAL
jgi:hypothetical protein